MATLEKTRYNFLEGAALLAKQRPSSALARARPLNDPLAVVTRKWGMSASAEQHAFEAPFLNELPPDVAVSPASAEAAIQAVADRGTSPDERSMLRSPSLVSPNRVLQARPPSSTSMNSGSPRRIAPSDTPVLSPDSSQSQSLQSPARNPRESGVDVTSREFAVHWMQARRAAAEALPGYVPPSQDPVASILRPDEVNDPISEQLLAVWKSISDDASAMHRLRKRICLRCGISKELSFEVVRQIHDICLGIASRTLNIARLDYATRRKDEDGLVQALRESSNEALWNAEVDFAWRDVLRLLSK